MIGHGPFRAWHGKAFFTLPYSRIVIGDAGKSIMLPDVPLIVGRRHKERAVALADAMNYAYRFGVKDVFKNRAEVMALLQIGLNMAESNNDGVSHDTLTKIQSLLRLP